MPTTQTRVHQKVDEEEIALVLQCKDSHEFYERYVKAFPKKRKGIESISKIWRRRSEFGKKQQQVSPQPAASPSKPVPATSVDLETLLVLQNKHMTELCALAREQLKVSKEILAQLKGEPEKPEVSAHKHRVTGITAQFEPAKKEPQKKKELAKPAPILIGS
ncbi:MAG: hypothetical protein NTZ39_01370 [Methanoregula sp.]|nr:hypothetical protein [Methanoregula sp.]